MTDGALLDLLTLLAENGYEFVTVTPETHSRVNRRVGNAWAQDLRGVFGWSRPFRPGILPERLLGAMEAAGVLEGTPSEGFRSTVRVSSLDGRLYVHSAFPTLAADAVFFGPDTFRATTAALAHLEHRRNPVRRIVDIGCGSGAIGITMAARRPEAELVMVDINDRALRLARINAAAAGLADRATAQRSDLLNDVDGEFDLAVSNPPFMIDPLGRRYRDGGVGGHGLPVKVMHAAVNRLAPGGSLVLFSGTGIVDGEDPLRAQVENQLAGTPFDWSYVEVDPDVYDEELDTPAYQHADRIALAVLTVQRPVS
ncbi:class I SAM-dependent methyltransferase [Kineosporia rhizophila]|uniref:N5-glutamine methyltransferase family protein n=1 Tax=Kineosporia rhizophila TaxID=84633 RepID=UPI001E3065EA|nr:class I SAM-dependent methyltransferase [Kineosporia rhizophila]MCE0536383.1 class I SAM-dependent methyltransferase [Kineosporia rhizophila]